MSPTVSRKLGRIANALLVACGAAGAVVLTRTLIRDPPYAPRTLAVYCILSLGLVATMILGLTRRAETRVNIALGVVAVGMAVFSVELMLDVLLPPVPPLVQRANFLGTPFDTRSPLEVARGLRSQGIDAIPTPLPFLFVPGDGIREGDERTFPLAGVSNRLTVFCNERGTYVTYDSDEHGFRNPVGIWGLGPPQIVLIGDSYTHGACVDDPDTISGRLRQKGMTVLNLGVSATGPLLQLAILSEFAAAMRPEHVIWLYYEGNDLEDLRGERSSALLTRYLEDGFDQGLIDRQRNVDELLERTYARYEVAARTQRARQVLNRLIRLRGLFERLDLHEAEEPHPDALFVSILQEARHRAASWGADMHFAYLPDFDRYAGGADWDSHHHRAAVLEAVASLGLPVIDFATVVHQLDDPLALFPLERGGHYSPAAYGMVADRIARTIPDEDTVATQSLRD